MLHIGYVCVNLSDDPKWFPMRRTWTERPDEILGRDGRNRAIDAASGNDFLSDAHNTVIGALLEHL